jgi:hypothetical protein
MLEFEVRTTGDLISKDAPIIVMVRVEPDGRVHFAIHGIPVAFLSDEGKLIMTRLEAEEIDRLKSIGILIKNARLDVDTGRER